MGKSHENKKDFIDKLMSMTDTEINDYIKQHGKRPKPIMIIDKLDEPNERKM